MSIVSQTLTIVPSSLALGYSLSSSIFLANFGEAGWFEYASHWLPRTAVLCAVLGIQSTSPITASFSTLVSSFLIYRTRKLVIEGGSPPSTFSLAQKIYIVTGGNTGIGKETVALLALNGAKVIMACRSPAKAQAAKQDILKQYPKIEKEQIEILILDLSSLESVRKAAASVQYTKIDGLVNNAGVMMGTQEFTVDGYELTMQANHLGHYLFTRLLMDKLKDDARIINVSSSTYTFCESMDVDDLFAQKGRKYTLFGQYAQSKLANLLFTNELASRGYNAFSVHPGMVRTDVTRNMPWYLRYPNVIFALFVAAFQKTPIQGAWNTVHVLTDPDVGAPGSYWVNRKVQAKKVCALDERAAKDLWTKSAELVGVPP